MEFVTFSCFSAFDSNRNSQPESPTNISFYAENAKKMTTRHVLKAPLQRLGEHTNTNTHAHTCRPTIEGHPVGMTPIASFARFLTFLMIFYVPRTQKPPATTFTNH